MLNAQHQPSGQFVVFVVAVLLFFFIFWHEKSVLGGRSFHLSTVTRRGSDGHEGRKDRPHIGPGTYHRASRMFFAKNEAIMFLPGSRRGFHSFLRSGRSKVSTRSVADTTIVYTRYGAKVIRGNCFDKNCSNQQPCLI